MQFVPYRMLRNQPGQLSKKLLNDGQIVVTKGGQPFAVMINVKEGELDDILALLSRLRAQSAVSAMRRQAREQGLDSLSPEEIESEISAARSERKNR